jgi:hypothetical protein
MRRSPSRVLKAVSSLSVGTLAACAQYQGEDCIANFSYSQRIPALGEKRDQSGKQWYVSVNISHDENDSFAFLTTKKIRVQQYSAHNELLYSSCFSVSAGLVHAELSTGRDGALGILISDETHGRKKNLATIYLPTTSLGKNDPREIEDSDNQLDKPR